MLFNDSTPGRALFRGIDEGEVLLSQELLEQITQVLMREKFDTLLSRARRTRAINSRPSLQDADDLCRRVLFGLVAIRLTTAY